MPSDLDHWNNAYSSTDATKLGWYQKEHAVSMDLISYCDGKNLIDVGAGTTTLIDSLVDDNYDVTVLDISSEALRLLSKRHGDNIKYLKTVLIVQFLQKRRALRHADGNGQAGTQRAGAQRA